MERNDRHLMKSDFLKKYDVYEKHPYNGFQANHKPYSVRGKEKNEQTKKKSICTNEPKEVYGEPQEKECSSNCTAREE